MRGAVLPIVLIITVSLSVIVMATAVLIKSFQQEAYWEVAHQQAKYLAESAVNLGLSEIKSGINYDNSDTGNFYNGIGDIDPYNVTLILDRRELNASFYCKVDNKINKYYKITGTASIDLDSRGDTEDIKEKISMMVKIQ